MLKPIKELGQNFLHDHDTAHKMINNLELKPGDILVEIGPGPGVLSGIIVDEFYDKGIEVYFVDIDKRFVDNLLEKYKNHERIHVVEANILDWLPTFKPGRPFKIVGSLPYYITSPIIHAVIKMELKPEVCVFMVQKEVAQKIAAQAPDSSYLSSFVQTFYEVKMISTVSRFKFNPAPKVDGGVLKLTEIKSTPLDYVSIVKYEGFLHRGYSNPRKMLNKVFNSEELAKIDVQGNLRPQNVDAYTWSKAFKILTGYEV